MSFFYNPAFRCARALKIYNHYYFGSCSIYLLYLSVWFISRSVLMFDSLVLVSGNWIHIQRTLLIFMSTNHNYFIKLTLITTNCSWTVRNWEMKCHVNVLLENKLKKINKYPRNEPINIPKKNAMKLWYNHKYI